MARTSERNWLGRLVAASALRFFIEVTPVPAPRPRVPKFGKPYYPAPYPEYMGQLQRAIPELVGPWKPTGKPVVVSLEVIRPRPKTTKLLTPQGDVDNLAKGPMDAITKSKLVWEDDKQVASLLTTKRFADEGETPGIHVAINTLED